MINIIDRRNWSTPYLCCSTHLIKTFSTQIIDNIYQRNWSAECMAAGWQFFSSTRSVNLSICRSVNLLICQSVDLSICRSVNLSICRSVDLSICQSVDLLICQSVNLLICQSVDLSICRSVDTSVRHCVSGWPWLFRQFVSCRSRCPLVFGWHDICLISFVIWHYTNHITLLSLKA
jgi:hypothetical protein